MANNGYSLGTLNDFSGTITTGGTAQSLMLAAVSIRRYFLFQNVSTGDLWINFGVTAVASQPSIRIAAGSGITFEGDFFVPQASVSVIGATTGQAFTCKEGI